MQKRRRQTLELLGWESVISDINLRGDEIIIEDGDFELAALVPMTTYRTLELRFKRFLDDFQHGGATSRANVDPALVARCRQRYN